MSERVKLSVIVPVYNTEKYLPECLESIFAQTFKDFELICVDDGSTDGSLKILNEYKLNHPNLIVISQQNQGESVARNTGMEVANGEYITFVDSDDFIKPDMFKALIEKAQDEDLDIVWCGYSLFYPKDNTYIDTNETLFVNALKKTGGFLQGAEEVFLAEHTAWGKTYKTDFLKLYKFTFPKGIVMGPDAWFYRKALIYAKKINVIPYNYYIYRQQVVGQLTSVADERYFDCIKVCKEIKNEILNSNKLNLLPWFNHFGISFISWGYNKISNDYKLEYYKQFKDFVLSNKIAVSNIAYPKSKGSMFFRLKYMSLRIINFLALSAFKLNSKFLFDCAMNLRIMSVNMLPFVCKVLRR